MEDTKKLKRHFKKRWFTYIKLLIISKRFENDHEFCKLEPTGDFEKNFFSETALLGSPGWPGTYGPPVSASLMFG